MGLFFILFIFLSSITVLTLHILYKDKISQTVNLAIEDAKNQIYFSYLSSLKFPDNVEIDFYPFYDYSKTDTKAELYLYGEDKKKGTNDDLKIVWQSKELLSFRYIEAKERARILEQTAYAICQRRLANKEEPIFPPTLDDLMAWSGLPEEYRYTPFGREYNYDVSSCKEDYCYCSKPIVNATGY
jgi:hypothetical protein